MRIEACQEEPVEVGFSSSHSLVAERGLSLKGTPIADRVFAFGVLLITSPLLCLIGFLIALGGQKPFFLQERIGFAGKPFWIFKFRTIPDGGWDISTREAAKNPLALARLALFKTVSRILRSTGLDELPQFANILKGDMQIIGPRPLIFDDFVALPEGRMERCVVPPGITGLAQINGGQDLGPRSKLALDLYVIDHLSLGLAVKIVFRTFLRIVVGAGATANANARDLARAEKHVAARIRLSSTVMIEARTRTQRSPRRRWLGTPARQLQPIHVSALAPLKTAPVDLQADIKDMQSAALENR